MTFRAVLRAGALLAATTSGAMAEGVPGIPDLSGSTLEKGGPWGLLGLALLAIVYLMREAAKRETAKDLMIANLTAAITGNSAALNALTKATDANADDGRLRFETTKNMHALLTQQTTLQAELNRSLTEIRSDLRAVVGERRS